MELREHNSKNFEDKTDKALATLDRFFTLFFVVTSVIIVPSTMSVINASATASDSTGLARGVMWSSIIGSILLVVAIYGMAVLLNYQWLRLTGIYGLICLFAEAWLWLSTWLSTDKQYWTLFNDPKITPVVNFLCIFVAILIYYAWQKRNKIQLGKTSCLVGIVASFNLFLVFNFLQSYPIVNYSSILSGNQTIMLTTATGLLFLLFTMAMFYPICSVLNNRRFRQNSIRSLNRQLRKNIFTFLLIFFQIVAFICLMFPLLLEILSIDYYSIFFIVASIVISISYVAMVAIADTSIRQFRDDIAKLLRW